MLISGSTLAKGSRRLQANILQLGDFQDIGYVLGKYPTVCSDQRRGLPRESYEEGHSLYARSSDSQVMLFCKGYSEQRYQNAKMAISRSNIKSADTKLADSRQAAICGPIRKQVLVSVPGISHDGHLSITGNHDLNGTCVLKGYGLQKLEPDQGFTRSVVICSERDCPFRRRSWKIWCRSD
jgi:hypothetical protein